MYLDRVILNHRFLWRDMISPKKYLHTNQPTYLPTALENTRSDPRDLSPLRRLIRTENEIKLYIKSYLYYNTLAQCLLGELDITKSAIDIWQTLICVFTIFCRGERTRELPPFDQSFSTATLIVISTASVKMHFLQCFSKYISYNTFRKFKSNSSSSKSGFAQKHDLDNNTKVNTKHRFQTLR